MQVTGRELAKCRFCKHDRLACTFYSTPKGKMCSWCHHSYMAGKKRVGTHWVGPRKPIDKIKRKAYYYKRKSVKDNEWYTAWLGN